MTLKRATIDELAADPGLYDAVLARLIGAHQAETPLEHPHAVCKEMGLSYGGLIAWINADTTGKRMQQFRNVQEIRAHLLAEQALPIADGADALTPGGIPKARLQVETRKWLARAYAPSIYGNDNAPSASAHVTVILSAEDMRG